MRWSDIPFRPSIATLRWFAALGCLMLVILAGWQLLVRDNRLTGTMLLAGAVIVGIVGAWRPVALRPIFVGWMVLVFPVNWVISHLILACVYYCVFTPVAVFFQLIGRDALSRRFRPEQESYWTDKPAARDMHSYFRQS